MICSQCNHDNLATNRFCATCGSPLGTRAGMPCRSCATINKPDAHFCVRCGVDLVGVAVGSARPAGSVSTLAAPVAPVAPVAPIAPIAPAITPPKPLPVTVRPLALAGALIAALGVFLDWTGGDSSGLTSLHVPWSFLYDYNNASSDTVTVGVFVLILAACAACTAVIPQPTLRRASRPIGVVLVIIAVSFIVQLTRLANYLDASVTDVLGAGAFTTMVGGILLIVQKPRSN